MFYARVEDGTVVQVLVSDDMPAPWIATETRVSVGWSYDGQDFTAPPGPSTEELLAMERQGMRAWRRAFRLATLSFDDPEGEEGPVLTTFGAANLLEAWDAVIAIENDPYGTLTMATADVNVFERTHPDMEGFRLALSLSETLLDDVFRAARQIDASVPPA